jgi:hypothetical protein
MFRQGIRSVFGACVAIARHGCWGTSNARFLIWSGQKSEPYVQNRIRFMSFFTGKSRIAHWRECFFRGKTGLFLAEASRFFSRKNLAVLSFLHVTGSSLSIHCYYTSKRYLISRARTKTDRPPILPPIPSQSKAPVFMTGAFDLLNFLSISLLKAAKSPMKKETSDLPQLSVFYSFTTGCRSTVLCFSGADFRGSPR